MAVSFNLPDPYEAQKAEIARRQKYAQALEQQAFQPVETYSYQGIQAPIPATAALAKVLAGLGAGYFEGQAAREQRELREGDIKKSQEFAAALQRAKTPEERQALATTALGGTLGQRAQAMAGPIFTMAETAAEKEANRAFREAESARAREAQAANREADRDTKLMIANMMTQLRAQGMSEAAAQREATLRLQEELGRGRLEVQRTEAERRAERDLDKTPVNAITAYTAASQAEQAAKNTIDNMTQHIKDIESKKLDIGFFANPTNRAMNWLGVSTESGVKLAALDRDIQSAAQAILMAAKGTQTEGDRRAAVEMVLNKATSSDPKIVKDALTDLVKMSTEAQAISRNTKDQLGRTYRGLGHEPSPAAPGAPRAPAAPAAAPGAPAAPGAAPRRVVVDY